MAYFIADGCIGCGACQPLCPNEAIRGRDGEVYTIDAELCTECVGFYPKPRCASVCAFEVCRPDPSRPESGEELLAKFRRLHPDIEPKLGA